MFTLRTTIPYDRQIFTAVTDGFCKPVKAMINRHSLLGGDDLDSFSHRGHIVILLSIFLLLAPSVVYGTAGGKYLTDLHSSDINTRVSAATALAQAHNIDGVRTALQDTDAKVRLAAIYNLSISSPRSQQRRDSQAVAIFMDRLKDKDAHVRQAAVRKLYDYEVDAFFGNHDMEPDICMSLAPLLSDPDKNVRYDTVMTVDRCGLEKIDKELLRLANDKKETIEIRSASINVLARSKITDIDMQLLRFLDDSEDSHIKGAAIFALGELKSTRALDKILPFIHDMNRSLQNVAVGALGKIGGPKAAAALSDVLIDDKGKVDIIVLDNLGKTSSPEVFPKLMRIQHLITEPNLKMRFADALGATGNDDAVMPLLELVKDANSGVQYAASRNLEKFDSPAALKMIINESRKEPNNLVLSNLARKAQRKLDFPEEARQAKQRQKEDAYVMGNEQEINKVYYSALRLFKAKKYKETLPMFYSAVDQFEKLYASHPQQFKSYFNKITSIRIILADYYRWKVKDINKAIEQYDKLIATLKNFGSDSKALVPYFFALAEIYEKDVKDYDKAVECYKEVLKPFVGPKNIKPDEKVLAEWFLDWVNFRIERIKVMELKQQPAFTRRTLKYPNLGYVTLSMLGAYLIGPPETFVDEDIFNPGSAPQGPDIFDKFYERYPGSFKTMFMGLALFHQLLKDKPDIAIVVAEKIIRSYPDDLNTVMLCLEVADLYKSQQNMKKYKEYLEKGRKAATALNVELAIGPDPRFATPEDTWRLMVESLKKDDIDTAAACFSLHSSEKYRQIFTEISNVKEIAADMGPIQKITMDAESAKYRILRKQNGQEITYFIYFVNILGEWKIEDF